MTSNKFITVLLAWLIIVLASVIYEGITELKAEVKALQTELNLLKVSKNDNKNI